MKKFLFTLTLALATPAVALAENTLGQPIKGPEGLIHFVQTVSNWVFVGILALAVLFVLLAAYEYMTAGSEGVEKAHKMLLYAAIAVVVSVVAKGVVVVAAKIAGQTGNITL